MISNKLVEELKNELLEVISWVVNVTKDVDQKNFLECFRTDAEYEFIYSQNPEIISKNLKTLLEKLYLDKGFHSEYAVAIVEIMMQKTICMLDGINAEYNEDEEDLYFETAEDNWINEKTFVPILKILGEDNYKNFVISRDIYLEYFSFHPMFLEILKADEQMLLKDVKADDKYIFGLMGTKRESDDICDVYYLVKSSKSLCYEEGNFYKLEDLMELSSNDNPLIIKVSKYDDGKITLEKIR